MPTTSTVATASVPQQPSRPQPVQLLAVRPALQSGRFAGDGESDGRAGSRHPLLLAVEQMGGRPSRVSSTLIWRIVSRMRPGDHESEMDDHVGALERRLQRSPIARHPNGRWAIPTTLLIRSPA